MTMTLLILSGFVVTAVIWAAIAQVREVPIGQGEMMRRGQVYAVQHFEGGIIAEIFVHEGDAVTAAQPLVRLRPEAAISEREQFESRKAGLELQLIRLEAQSRDETP